MKKNKPILVLVIVIFFSGFLSNCGKSPSYKSKCGNSYYSRVSKYSVEQITDFLWDCDQPGHRNYENALKIQLELLNPPKEEPEDYPEANKAGEEYAVEPEPEPEPKPEQTVEVEVGVKKVFTDEPVVQKSVYAKETKSYHTLATFYTAYSTLKRCHEVRKGFAVVFVNSVEMEKIKSNAKKIETGIIKEYPELNSQKDKIWKEATKPITAMQAYLLTSELKPVYGTIQVPSDLKSRELCRVLMDAYEKIINQYAGGEGAIKDF